METVRTTNRNCRKYVTDRIPFVANNIYGFLVSDTMYVVVSYEKHFPIFIYKDGMWFENMDMYSVTTSKHKGQARPTHRARLLNTEDMIKLMNSYRKDEDDTTI